MQKANVIGVSDFWIVLQNAVPVRSFYFSEALCQMKPWTLIGCLACWCPCLLHSQNRRRLESLNTTGLPDPHRDQLVAGDSWFYALIEVGCDMGWILQVRCLVPFMRCLGH